MKQIESYDTTAESALSTMLKL